MIKRCVIESIISLFSNTSYAEKYSFVLSLIKTIFNESLCLFEHYFSNLSRNASNSYRRRSSLHENHRCRNSATSINHISALILRQSIRNRSFELFTRFVDLLTSCVDFAFEIESSFNSCKNRSSISSAYESFTISMM